MAGLVAAGEEAADEEDVGCSGGNHGDDLKSRPEVDTFEVLLRDAAVAQFDRLEELLHADRLLKIVVDLLKRFLQSKHKPDHFNKRICNIGLEHPWTFPPTEKMQIRLLK